MRIFIMNKRLFGVLVLCGLSACSSSFVSVLKNTSPEPIKYDIDKLSSIPASISINAEKKEIVSDVKLALSRNNVFSEVTDDANKSELLLKISHHAIADHHADEGMFDAILSGITFGLKQSNPAIFDYSVSVNADLIYKGHTIGHYDTKGSYHTEVSDAAKKKEKVDHTSQAVKLSFEHALNLLSEKIKKDRENIIAAMQIETPTVEGQPPLTESK